MPEPKLSNKDKRYIVDKSDEVGTIELGRRHGVSARQIRRVLARAKELKKMGWYFALPCLHCGAEVESETQPWCGSEHAQAWIRGIAKRFPSIDWKKPHKFEEFQALYAIQQMIDDGIFKHDPETGKLEQTEYGKKVLAERRARKAMDANKARREAEADLIEE